MLHVRLKSDHFISNGLIFHCKTLVDAELWQTSIGDRATILGADIVYAICAVHIFC